MTKNYNVRVEDNGEAFLVVINKGTEQRFVVCSFGTIAEAWEHIEWMYLIENQEFTVGKKNIPVAEWVEGMKKMGYLD